MSGIQSSVGLVSGVDIAGTVSQLIAIAARPRDALIARSEKVAKEQAAITDLTTLVVGLELAAKRLGGGDNSVFSSVRVKSSNNDLLSASSKGSPAVGSYTVTPIRKAQTNQLLSSRFNDPEALLGAGSISFQSGGHVRQSVSLDSLNGGQGVDRGKIRITDRSGTSQIIDLRYAKTTQDVVDTINEANDINVRAELDGDRIKLVDGTGQNAANLQVQEVGTDTTAADLGLAGINTNSATAFGNDIYNLSRNTLLQELNNNNGVGISSGVDDLVISLADGGANIEVDLSGSSNLGDVLDKINAVDPGRLQAQISAGGDSIEIIDLTTGGGTFSVSSGSGSSAAEDLGIATTGTGTITGSRINAGLDTVLLSRLNGGQGLGELGQLSITNRAGNSATIDLSAAETLDDVISAINSAGIQVQAKVNETGVGFQLQDTSGGSNDLIVASGADGLNTASKLKIEGNFDANTASSEPLNLQSVNRSTRLEDFRGGVTNGSFLIKDSSGATSAVNLRVLEAETIGDVLDAINSLSIGVQAEINEEGNGIKLVDTAGGSDRLLVTDSGSGTAAEGLGIAGTGIDGDPGEQFINGTQRTTIEITDEDTLDSLIEKINNSDSGVRAARFFDGVGYRLNLISDTPGAKGDIWLESTLDASFETIAKGQDALLQYGPGGSSASLLLSSDSNTFGELIPDVEFTINGVTNEEIQVDVERNETAVTEAVKLFVEQFNKVTNKVNEYTKFESETTSSGVNITTGLLFGTSEALRVEQSLSRLATGSFTKVGNLSNLRDIGIEYDFESETLSLDEEKFKEVFAEDPQAVQDFFYKSTTVDLGGDETETRESGIAFEFQELTDRLAGIENSLLLNRNNALQRQIETFNERIELKNSRLEAQQTRLLKTFYKMEETLSRLQEGQTALNAMQIIPPIGSSNS